MREREDRVGGKWCIGGAGKPGISPPPTSRERYGRGKACGERFLGVAVGGHAVSLRGFFEVGRGEKIRAQKVCI